MASNQGYARAFWAAVGLTLLLWVVPFGALIIYPFSLLATWAHEMGHGLAALAVGGEFFKLELFGDLSGVASTSSSGPLSQALVSAGGLVACLGLGAAVMLAGWRLAQDHRFFLVQLLGIQLTLSALRGWRYFFVSSASVGGRIMPSDTAGIGHALGGPPQLWGGLLILFNLILRYGAYRAVSRRLARS